MSYEKGTHPSAVCLYSLLPEQRLAWGMGSDGQWKVTRLMYWCMVGPCGLLAGRRKGWRHRDVYALEGRHVSLPAWDNLPWSPSEGIPYLLPLRHDAWGSPHSQPIQGCQTPVPEENEPHQYDSSIQLAPTFHTLHWSLLEYMIHHEWNTFDLHIGKCFPHFPAPTET